MIYGEAYHAFLDMRAAKPTGSFFLDIQSAEARAGRDEMAEKYRERTAFEMIGERIQEMVRHANQRARDREPGR